jgi:enamine deaminase RidA (YjgF/YER057c/UK114 family)
MTAETPQARFASLQLTLPPPPQAAGLYKPCLVVGGLAYLSGHLPAVPGGGFILGKVGADLDADAGKQAARQVGLTMLATLVASFGSLDRIARVVKLLGLVNCTADFTKHPHVINGCSELFAAIWGPDLGVGARSAVGAASLPLGVAVEIEAVFEVA